MIPRKVLTGTIGILVFIGGYAYVRQHSGTPHIIEAPGSARAASVSLATPAAPPERSVAPSRLAASRTAEAPAAKVGRADMSGPIARPEGADPVVALQPPGGTNPAAPSAGSGQSPPNASPGAGMTVTGIVGGRDRVAILERGGEVFIVRAGDRIENATVVTVLDQAVVLTQDGRSFTLGLAPAVRFSLAAVGGAPTLAVPAVGSAEGVSPQPSPPPAAAPQQPSGVTSVAEPAAPAVQAETSAPQTSTTAATGVVSTSFYSAPPSIPVVGATINQPPPVPTMPPGATVFTPTIFIGTIGYVVYPLAVPPSGAAAPQTAAITTAVPGAAPAPATAVPAVGPSAPPSSPPPAQTPPQPTGGASAQALASNLRLSQITAGPIIGRGRADAIANRLMQAGIAVGVSVNGQGTIERFRVVSEVITRASAARRAAALADLHPAQEPLPGGQARLVFGVFGSRQDATALIMRIRARGYSATAVAEQGPAYVTNILVPDEKGAIARSREIIRSVGTDVPVAIEPVP